MIVTKCGEAHLLTSLRLLKTQVGDSLYLGLGVLRLICFRIKEVFNGGADMFVSLSIFYINQREVNVI